MCIRDRRLAAREGVDLVHSLASTAPLWGRFTRVVTVHDLIYRRYPEAHSGLRSLGMRVLVPLAVRRSGRVTAHRFQDGPDSPHRVTGVPTFQVMTSSAWGSLSLR